jgi:electron transport complex protein RnfD
MDSTKKLIVSTSPHIKSSVTTQRIMLDVLIALAPSAIAAVVFYGWAAVMLIGVCVGVAVGSEALFCLINHKKQTVVDLSAAVTGLILALSLPATVNFWQAAVGSVFAIIVVKCLFGGIGCNFANPAATARVLLVSAFSTSVAGGVATRFAELTSGATPLAVIKSAAAGYQLPSLLDMLLGVRGGAVGEGCAVAILLGFVYLVVRGVIKWYVPASFAATLYAVSLIKFWVSDGFTAGAELALYQLLGGGALFCAVFMITDYVSTPINSLGKVVFAVGAALITCLIRFFGNYPEGVSFAILLMNILSPYIEKMCTPRPFGALKAKKEAK